MENKLIFGTYNVPPITNESLTASFTTQGNITKEMLEKIYCSEQEIDQEEVKINSFDETLKALLKVPKPKK